MLSILCALLLAAGSGGVAGCREQTASKPSEPAPQPPAQSAQSSTPEPTAEPQPPAPEHVLALLNSEQCAAHTLSDPDANHTVRMPLAVISGMEQYDLRLAPDPELPPLNQPFTLRVEITERTSGNPAPVSDDVELLIDAWMPEHLHGLTARPSIQSEGDGVYTVSNLLLHMEGKWQMYFDITDGPLTERAQIDLAIQ